MKDLLKELFGVGGKKKQEKEGKQKKSIYDGAAKKKSVSLGGRKLVKGSDLVPAAEAPEPAPGAESAGPEARAVPQRKPESGPHPPQGAAADRKPEAAPIRDLRTPPPRRAETGPIKSLGTPSGIRGTETGPLQRIGTSPYLLEDNRRKHRRVPLREWARIAVAGIERQQQAMDISEGGIRLGPSSVFQLFTQVQIVVPLPQWSSDRKVLCPVKGVVVWSNRNGIGVKFKDLTEEAVVQLREFIERNLEDGGT